ncbi:MAG TPA: cytidylate kinase-like family protein [Gemmataceae bacterium]|jgi:cytidylate kinase
MTVTGLIHRQAEALEHLLVGYRTEPESRTDRAKQTELDRFTIAISREIGTPALEVAQQVGDRLAWPVYDREVPKRIAEELHLPLAAVEGMDERRKSWLLECFEAFGSGRELSQSRYFHHLICVVRSLGEQGHCLIMGHAAAFLLPPQQTLRVRLVGDRHDRIAALGRASRLDHWTATRQLDQINHEHSRFMREHFHVDPSQPRSYDLVLNTSQWSPSDCSEFILHALRQKATGRQS